MSNKSNDKPKMIGVHTLSEFVFCPRAGVISHERQNDDAGVDTGFVDLSYSPDYDIVLAKQEVGKIIKRLENFSFGFLGGTLATVIFGFAIKPFLGLLCLLILIPTVAFLAPRLYRDVVRYRHLKKQIQIYNRQKDRLPDLDKLGTEEIPWYSLLKSCDVEKCHDLLIDEDLGVCGKPWKLLHCGDACLPVFFCRKPESADDSEDDPTAWLKKQHSVRMRAYCHLIEKNTGKHSSCGIIVFAGSMNAVAIKFWKDKASDRQFKESLLIARETVLEFEQHEKVGIPATNVCIRCHLGRPKVYRLEPGVAYRNGSPIRPMLHQLKNKQNKNKSLTLHSVCGDFFKWIPPHEKATELKLAPKPSLEPRDPELEPETIV